MSGVGEVLRGRGGGERGVGVRGLGWEVGGKGIGKRFLFFFFLFFFGVKTAVTNSKFQFVGGCVLEMFVHCFGWIKVFDRVGLYVMRSQV